MGFFKNIFKKKEGGTFVGNLLRGTSSAMTGGLLGSGAELHKWEEEQRAKGLLGSTPPIQNQGYNAGQNLVQHVAIPAGVDGGSTNPKIGESVLLYSLKKHWWKIALAVLVLVFGVWYLSKPKGNKSTFKFRR